MDTNENFFEVKSQAFRDKADWAFGDTSLEYTTKRPVLTGNSLHIRREVRIKAEKYAKVIFPIFVETLGDLTTKRERS
jgi:hypothetical protein